MKKNQWFALLLALCLWWTATATAEEILAAPVEETVADAQADLWTKDIAEDVAKAEAEAAAMDAGDVPIDEAHFPDANFRAYIQRFDTSGNGALSDAERAAVTEIDVGEGDIGTLQGIEYFSALKTLYCFSNHIATLDVSENTSLELLSCSYNWGLTTLRLGENEKLASLFCVNTGMSAIPISGCPKLIACVNNAESISEEDGARYYTSGESTVAVTVGNTFITGASDDVPIDEAHFPDANFRAYVLDHCDKDKNGILSNAEAGAVTFLWVNNENIASLEGVEYFFALNDLVCQGNPLTSLDVSKCARLTKLDCMSSQLTSLNISGCVDLQTLKCQGNQLAEIDVSHCGSLKTILCDGNQLTGLDVSWCPALEKLDCSHNQLTDLDVSRCPSLLDLNCSDNRLTALDVSRCAKLVELGCSYNQLARLDVSQNAALEVLVCSDNFLPSLDVSGHAALKDLSCSVQWDPEYAPYEWYPYLDSVNLSGCSSLYALSVDSNSLTEIDISQCPKLGQLNCTFTYLTRLDISHCPTLVALAQLPPIYNGHHVIYGEPYPSDDEPFLKLQDDVEIITQPSEPVKISQCKIGAVKDQTYTGKALKPKPVVKYNGVKLVKGTDYTLSWKNNTKIGLATVTVKGKGNFTGTKKVTFKINPKAVALSKLTAGKKKLTVKWKKGAGGAGYQLQYATKKNFSGKKTVTVAKTATTSRVIKSLKSGKTYYVRIRAYKKAGGKTYVSKWSKVLSKKVK